MTRSWAGEEEGRVPGAVNEDGTLEKGVRDSVEINLSGSQNERCYQAR